MKQIPAYATAKFTSSVFLWVDGRRTPACSSPANFTDCSDSDTFSFADPTLSAYNSSWWAANQPSGTSGSDTTTLQQVITMMFPVPKDNNTGKLDDV